MKFATPIAGAILLFCTIPAPAHHSLEAQYDPTRSVTLKGTLTKMDWSNPHVRFFVDVTNGDKTVNWTVEMGSPNAQLMEGWKIDSFRVGDRVTVSVYPARDGSSIGFIRKITKGFH